MRNRGFTLIELLITIAIMGLAMGLVGPLAIEQLDKFRAQDELVQLEKTIKNQRRLAFINHHTIHITFENQRARISISDDNQQITEFEFISFEPQQLIINRNGFMQPTEVAVEYNNQQRVLEFENAGVY